MISISEGMFIDIPGDNNWETLKDSDALSFQYVYITHLKLNRSLSSYTSSVVSFYNLLS